MRGPCIKNEGLVFHGTARAIRLINSLLDGKNENIPNIHRQVADNFSKNQKHFPKFDNLPKFSKNFETILLNVRFQFCLAAESIGQDGAILPDDRPNQIARKQGMMSSHKIKRYTIVFAEMYVVFEML